jgi:hypothetical protein
MPYIITTAVPWGRNLGARDKFAVSSRRAAATLADAKGVAWSAIEDAAGGDDLGVEDQAIADLPPEGGAITLANGARVEVEQVRWSAINPDMDGDPMGPEDAAIEVETYNARQVA